MALRLRTLGDVRAFSVALTAIVLLGHVTLQNLVMPAPLSGDIRWVVYASAVALTAPLSFYAGLRLRDVHLLCIAFETAALRDPLTGLLTRRAFFEETERQAPCEGCVIVADIDHFKTCNDRYGHAAGDAALRAVAHLFLTGCRAGDVVARFGGEEFVLLLKHTSQCDGMRVAERLRARLNAKPIMHDGRAMTLSASFGVAPLGTGVGIEVAIARADDALYAAKAGGRDRVVLAAPDGRVRA